MDNRRQVNRIAVNYPIDLKIDSQITLGGRLLNLSTKSAFIQIKSSVPMQINDQFDFHIDCGSNDEGEGVSGTICISRISHGEGIAVYFTEMDESSSSRLKQLIG